MDQDLADRLNQLHRHVAEAVKRFRDADLQPDDPFRGMYVSDAKADQLLEQMGQPNVIVESVGELPAGQTRLAVLAQRFSLAPIDVDVLVAVMAPDIDNRFERLYGYLHDDLSRRRASIGLSLELAGCRVHEAAGRARITAGAPLVDGGLVLTEELDRPFLTRTLRAPDRVVAHLIGDDALDAELVDARIEPARVWGDQAEALHRVLQLGKPVYLRERVESGATGIATEALRRLTCSTERYDPGNLGARDVEVLDLVRLASDDTGRIAASATRESLLSGRGLVLVNVDLLEGVERRQLANADLPLVLVGSEPWDPEWADQPLHTINIEPPPETTQIELWTHELAQLSSDPAANSAGAFAELAALGTFKLGPQRIRRAVATAEAAASEIGCSVDTTSLAAGARAQNSVGLSRLARRIEPEAGWDAIVLEPTTKRQLEHLSARVAHRRRVLDEWGLRRGGGRGEGIIALFAGDSGTGKTLAAEVIAKELALELYVIDLSTVVDKYIGETEKNLDRIFTEAEGVNGILFFDEADALFGKRTEVSDARDRYANVEVAYLLQRLEAFDGLSVLATNLKANIDEAFSRRLSIAVEFRDPDPAQRLRLWQQLAGRTPIGSTVDYDFLADSFELTGGNIRNVVVAAAYLAASNGQVVEMPHLIHGTEMEYRKLGRLCTEQEFGPYYDLLAAHEDRTATNREDQ